VSGSIAHLWGGAGRLGTFAFGGAIPHAPKVRDALQRLIDDVLNPLLEKDASSIELVAVRDDEVVVRVGDDCASRIKKTVPTAKRRM
jgi:hypothetical protein